MKLENEVYWAQRINREIADCIETTNMTEFEYWRRYFAKSDAKDLHSPFWDHRIWTHPVDMIRFASILFVIVMGIFRIIQLLLGGVP